MVLAPFLWHRELGSPILGFGIQYGAWICGKAKCKAVLLLAITMSV